LVLVHRSFRARLKKQAFPLDVYYYFFFFSFFFFFFFF